MRIVGTLNLFVSPFQNTFCVIMNYKKPNRKPSATSTVFAFSLNLGGINTLSE
jgi:hypothetical protein